MKLKRNAYNSNDKEKLQELTSCKILLECTKRAINKIKHNTKTNIWTKNDYDFMAQNWGKLSKKEIAQKLNRSLEAVHVKAERIGLKNYFIYSEEMTLNSLYQLIYNRSFDSYTVGIWEKYDCPIYKTVPNDTLEMRTIKLSEFIEWFKEHKRLVDLTFSDDNCFGSDEPEWIKEKRQADKRAAAYGLHNKVWTKNEDATLISMLKEHKYGYREISVTLKRTEGAIKRRLCDLKIKERPIKAPNHNPWTEKEIAIVKDLYIKGYKSCVIAEEINRSALAINGLLERHKYFGVPVLKGGKNVRPNKPR